MGQIAKSCVCPDPSATNSAATKSSRAHDRRHAIPSLSFSKCLGPGDRNDPLLAGRNLGNSELAPVFVPVFVFSVSLPVVATMVVLISIAGIMTVVATRVARFIERRIAGGASDGRK